MPPDEITQQVAASSPAAVEVPNDPADYAEWRQTGKLPTPAKPAESPKDPKAEGADPPKPDADGDGHETDDSGAEPEKKQEPKPKPKNTAATRLREILDALKRAGLSPSELMTFKRELQKPPESKPPQNTEKTETPAGTEAPKKPKIDDFDTYEAYEVARDKYYEDLADYKTRRGIEEYAERQRMEGEQRELAQKVAAAKSRYGEEAEQTIGSAAAAVWNDADVHPTVKSLLGDSPVLVDVMYVLGSQPEELAGFIALAKQNPSAAIRKVVLLEGLVQAELQKGEPSQNRSDDGKFVAKPADKAPEKKPPEAPPPPTELGGRRAAPPDEIEGAFKAGDFRAFREAANRRDAHRKGT